MTPVFIPDNQLDVEVLEYIQWLLHELRKASSVIIDHLDDIAFERHMREPIVTVESLLYSATVYLREIITPRKIYIPELKTHRPIHEVAILPTRRLLSSKHFRAQLFDIPLVYYNPTHTLVPPVIEWNDRQKKAFERSAERAYNDLRFDVDQTGMGMPADAQFYRDFKDYPELVADEVYAALQLDHEFTD